jgi:hypothetical protein
MPNRQIVLPKHRSNVGRTSNRSNVRAAQLRIGCKQIFFYYFFFFYYFHGKQIITLVVHYDFCRVSSVINHNAINGDVKLTARDEITTKTQTKTHAHTLTHHYVIKLSSLLSCPYFLRCRFVLFTNTVLYYHIIIHSRWPHAFDRLSEIVISKSVTRRYSALI